MSGAGRWASFLLLPAAACVEAIAYEGARMAIPFVGAGRMSVEALGEAVAIAGVVALVAMLLSATAAALAGPWIPAILGALIVSVGLFAIPLVSSTPVALAIASFGHGFAQPALYGAAARALPLDRERQRDALFCFLFASVVAGRMTGPAGAGVILTADDAGAVFFACGALALFAFTIAGTVGIIVFLTGRGERARTEPPVRGAHLAAVIGIALVAAAAASAGAAAMRALWQADDASPAVLGRALAGGELASIAAALIAGAVALVLHAMRAPVRVPSLLVAGVALAVLGIGTMMVASSESIDGARVGLVVGGIAEALVVPLVLSRIAGDMPLRLETAAAALFLIATQALALASIAFVNAPLRSVLVHAGAIASLVTGVALAAASPWLRRTFPEAARTDAR